MDWEWMDRRFGKDKVAAHYPPRQFLVLLESSVLWLFVFDYPDAASLISHTALQTYLPQ
jgi:hypothetical protein